MSKHGLMIEESVVSRRIDEKIKISNSQSLPQKTDSHNQQIIEQLDLVNESKVIFFFFLHLITDFIGKIV